MSKTDSPLLAGPIGDCCVQSVKHSGEAVGKTIEIDGITTYLSEPPTEPKGKKQILLFFPDVFGPLSLNSQLLQDFFASNGFYVLGIDYFFGDTIDKHLANPDFDREAWFHKSRKIAEEAWPRWVEAVRKIYGEDAIYTAAGYCFGGFPAMELAATDKVVAAAFAHPAWLTEDHFRNVKKPLLMSCAEDDFTFSTESRRRGVDILTETKALYYLQVFGGVTHGFATKGDISVPHIRHAKEESARSIINWFVRWGRQ
ncbi:Alpha/Beta hydrolase protein [Coprinopsis sp. MPI-PUGE-AT-0042]|nr:Alpha/Beta hydrolase protein [Coprinopsis sp. MPI-PUGE-AT-0042]